ncbi:MAG TPA: site-specific integrase [Candidatus Fimimorpha faecalis]|uniref:Site-specific integrase n=1 Tax=Candidatus Fimimorpha faecalis TaxID=2840824 RepID=A0A9D1EC62_9FIRM|nr:site-specific integrase [Candidatus Fimimorpha faecalis]
MAKTKLISKNQQSDHPFTAPKTRALLEELSDHPQFAHIRHDVLFFCEESRVEATEVEGLQMIYFFQQIIFPAIQKQLMSVSTARSYYYNIKTFFVYLEECGIIPNGRTDRILPRTLLQSMSPERRTPPAPIPDSTIQIILQTSKELAPELYPILVVAAQCGLRTSEMIHLSTEDLFFEEGKWYLTVKRENTEEEERKRGIVLPDQIGFMLQNYRIAHETAIFCDSEHRLFQSMNGRPYSIRTLQRHVSQYMKQLMEKSLISKTYSLSDLRTSLLLHVLIDNKNIAPTADYMDISSFHARQLKSAARRQNFSEIPKELKEFLKKHPIDTKKDD